MPAEITYLEVNDRMYELVEIYGYPKDESGREVRCHVNYTLQRIEISEHVLPGEREALVRRAFGFRDSDQIWTIVPVRERVA